MLRPVSALPDPADLLAVADRIAGDAAAARERAGRLERAVADAGWRGFAADAFGAEAHLAAGSLRSAAAGLDHAVDALRRHVARVSGLVEDLVRVGSHEVDLLGDILLHPDEVMPDVGQLLGDGLDLVGDGFDLIGL